jgi:hypothetical protein
MVVKGHMPDLGYDTRDFAGNSLRRGMTTTAARNGAAERTPHASGRSHCDHPQAPARRDCWNASTVSAPAKNWTVHSRSTPMAKASPSAQMLGN